MAGERDFTLGLDLDQLRRDAAAAKAEFRGIGNTTVAESKRMTNSFGSIGRTVKTALGTAAIISFGKTMMDVRGQFQTFQAVLTNTFGDAKKAKSAMDMIQDFAATTPFQVDDLTGSFVKLANQGFTPAREEMAKLGDLASSTGKGFGQLTEAIIDAQTGEFERLKEFGIRASKEGDKVNFTFKEQKTQVDFTASAIREYILSLGEMKGVQGANAAIAATLTGQMSNLQDGITQMINEIGQSSEGVLTGVLSGASYLVEHYEEIGKVLTVLIATYGAYKAAVLATVAINRIGAAAQYSAEIVELQKLVAVKQSEGATDLEKLVIDGRMTAAQAEKIASLRAEAMARLETLKATAAQAQAEVSASIQSQIAAKARLQAAQESLRMSLTEVTAARASGDQMAINTAVSNARTAARAKDSAQAKLNIATTAVGVAQGKSESAMLATNTLEQNINTAATKGGATAKKMFALATNNVTKAFKSLKVAFASNPIGLLITIITTAATAMWAFGGSSKSAAEEIERLQGEVDQAGDAFLKLEEKQAGVKKLTDRVDELKGKSKLTKDETLELKDATQKLAEAFPSAVTGVNKYGAAIDVATGKINTMLAAQKQQLKLENKDLADELFGTFWGNVDQEYRLRSKASANRKEAKSIDYNATVTHGGRDDDYNKGMLENQRKRSANFREWADQNDAEAEIYKQRIKGTILNLTAIGYELSEIQSGIENSLDLSEWNPLNLGKSDYVIPENYVADLFEEIKREQAALKKINGEDNNEGIVTTDTPDNNKSPLAGTIDAYSEDNKRLKKLQDETAKNSEQYNKYQQQIDANNLKIAEINGQRKDELAKASLQAQKDAQDAETELTRSSIEDRIELIKSDTQQQLDAIQAQKEEFMNTFKGLEDTDEYKSGIAAFGASASTAKKQGKAKVESVSNEPKEREQEEYEERLKNFETFSMRYAELEQEHNERLEFIAQKGGDQADVDSENQNYEEDLQTLNDEVLATIGDFESLGVEAADRVIDDMIKNLQTAKSKLEGDPDAAKNVTKIKALNAEIERCKKLKEENNKTSQGRSLKEWQDMEKQLGDCVGAFKEIGDAVGGTTGQIISDAGDIAGSTISMISGIVQLTQVSIAGTEATSQAGASAIKAVETASVILAIIGAVISIITKLNNLIQGNKQAALQAEIDAYNVLVDTYDDLIDRQKELLENSTQATSFSGYLKALDLVESRQKAAADSLRKWFETDKGWFHRSEEEKFEENFGDVLRIEDIYDMTADDWTKFMEQHYAEWSKLPEEVRNYAESVIEAKDEVEELGDILGEKLTGISFDSLKDSFKDTLLDMESDAEDFVKNFADMMINSMAQAKMDETYNKKLEGFYNKYKSFAESDGRLDPEEIDELRRDWEDITTVAEADRDELRDFYTNVLGIAGDERTSASAGIATASQDSVDELNGRATAIQGHTFIVAEKTTEIAEILKEMSLRAVGYTGGSTGINPFSDTYGAEIYSEVITIGKDINNMRENAGHILELVTGIKEDTAHLHRLEAIDTNIGAMSKSMSSMAKGVKLK